MSSLTWDRHRGHASSYDVFAAGMNFRPSELTAALVGAGIDRLPGENEARREHLAAYQAGLSERGVPLVFGGGHGDHRAHRGGDRRPVVADAIREALGEVGIQTSMHYPPIHRFTYYRDRYGDVSLPQTEAAAAAFVTLPLWGGLPTRPGPRSSTSSVRPWSVDAAPHRGLQRRLGTRWRGTDARHVVGRPDPSSGVGPGRRRGGGGMGGGASPGARIVVVPEARNKADVGAILAHLRAIRRLRPDVLHVNDFTPWRGQYAQLAGLLTPGVRVVVWEHSTTPSSSRVQRGVKRALSRAAGAHLACGQWLAGEVERLLGRPPGSLRWIHNGIPPVLPPATSDLPEGFVIGTVGRLSAEKGFDVLLRAVARVPDVQVVLVGQGRRRAPFRPWPRSSGSPVACA